MKRKYFKIPFMNRMVSMGFTIYDRDDIYASISSGKPYADVQYLFMDFDDVYPLEEGEFIVEEYELKRAIIVESSPKKYQLLSFSPMPVGRILEIMFHSSCDKGHATQMMKKGYVDIRISAKKSHGRIGRYPRFKKAIKNMEGTNFYNFDAERIYKIMIKNSEKLARNMKREINLEEFITRIVERNRRKDDE